MGEILDSRADREATVAAAADALQAGELVVLPTDTVYGVAADAFNPAGTAKVFAAKRRSRTVPLPVLVRSPKQLLGLVTAVPEQAERLMAAWWPGPLTIVVAAEPHLAWDLGDNQGTVAVRMPFDEVTLDVIRAVGPLAVTSANLSGNPPATSAQLARAQLGDAVDVYVDGGPRREATPSTIVDISRGEPQILRDGPLDADEVLAVARGELEPHLATPFGIQDPPAESAADTRSDADTGRDADAGSDGDTDSNVGADGTGGVEPEADTTPGGMVAEGTADGAKQSRDLSRHTARDWRARP